MLQAAGRVALWALVGLLLLRGISGVLTEPRPADRGAAVHSSASDPATAVFAVRFARTYLSEPSPQALAPFLAPGTSAPVRLGTGAVAQVEQAEVAAVRELGDRQAIVTVACELDDARTLYLAVPIVREDAARGGGPEGACARRRSGVLSATSPGDLSYLLAPAPNLIYAGMTLVLR